MADRWRTAVRHHTGFEYEGQVRSSYNLARMSPRSSAGQLVLDHALHVTPAVSVFQYVDYWGTLVHTFDIHEPHDAMEVVATSVVETTDARDSEPGTGVDVDWQDLDSMDVRDRHSELLCESAMIPTGSTTLEIAAALRSRQAPAVVVEDVIAWVHDNLAYERGVTDVSTGSEHVLASRRGVCQDFAHVTIGLLRALGIPARYVSGYLYPDDAVELGATVSGESHAWVEAWLGCWHGIDPTTGEPVAQRHIRVAHGRDYADVAPLSGIYHGAPSKSLGVQVELTRLY